MKTIAPHTHWRSRAIYVPWQVDSQEFDLFVELVLRTLGTMRTRRRLIGDIFIVRYNDGRPHLRVRTRARHDAVTDSALLAVTTNVAQRVAAESQGQCSGHGALTFGPVCVDVATTTYSPEYERYGGAHGVHLAEQFACLSTDLAISLANKARLRTAHGKLTAAIVGSLILCRAFLPESRAIAQFLREYALGYERLRSAERNTAAAADWRASLHAQVARESLVLGDRIRAIAEDICANSIHDCTWRCHSVRVARWKRQWQSAVRAGRVRYPDGSLLGLPQAVSFLLPSYLHLYLNRVGIMPNAEIRVAYSLANALTPAGVSD